MKNTTDAVSILEYAEAYTVFKGNIKVQGICLTNIGHIHYKLKDYQKAAKNYEEASKCAYALFRSPDVPQDRVQEYIKLCSKRKYYASVCKYMHLKSKEGKPTEEEILEVYKQIEKTIRLIKKSFNNLADDILIMLNLISSKCLLMTRRLISAERDLHIAVKIFRNKKELAQQKRALIPIIPNCILKQRIILQKALVLIDFKKKKRAAYLLTSLLKVGKFYDPATRKEALQVLTRLLTFTPEGNLMDKYEELNNITEMSQLFNPEKNKNVILLVDSTDGDYFMTKTNLCCEIFDNLNSKDYVSLLSMSEKVKIVFSMANKTQNTVQLYNQLQCLEPSPSRKIPLMKGIFNAIEDMKTQCTSNLRRNNFHWIICIVSTSETSNFYPKICRKIEKDMKEYKIGFLFITVGNSHPKKFQELYKSVDFNNSTIFLNIESSFIQRLQTKGGRGRAFSIPKPSQSTTPQISAGAQQLRSLLKNMSNVEVGVEDLVYEKF
ncbi:unnamed protein product [Moneuplotes crassus]|uniref:VWFA domain-containing protein n=1 Tax=Euplotes crassus TaxID=5936 RepID=A0AAD1XV86_EUPCR|nr:unnamed protein product [Moneuplotes crassus]